MAEKMAEPGRFKEKVGTKIGGATVTTPQDLEGDSNGNAATTFQACGPGEVKEYGVEVRGSNAVRLGAVLEDADMTTKSMYQHKDAWVVCRWNREVLKAGEEAERSVGPDEYAVGTHHVKIDNIKSKLFVDGEAVLDLPKGKAFRLGVSTHSSDCKLRLGSVKTEETTGACVGGAVVCWFAFSHLTLGPIIIQGYN